MLFFVEENTHIYIYIYIYIWLVFLTILKHMSSSMGRIIPYILWNIKHV